MYISYYRRARAWLLGLQQKQNGCLWFQPLKGFIYGLLMMAKLAGLLMGVKDIGKLQNRKLFLFLFSLLFLVFWDIPFSTTNQLIIPTGHTNVYSYSFVQIM